MFPIFPEFEPNFTKSVHILNSHYRDSLNYAEVILEIRKMFAPLGFHFLKTFAKLIKKLSRSSLKVHNFFVLGGELEAPRKLGGPGDVHVAHKLLLQVQ